MIDRRKITLNYIAILLLFMTMGVGTFENPAIQTVIDAWPQISESSIRMMITLPCLSSMITMILIGHFVGHKISYKMITLIGLIIILLSGTLPFFIQLDWIMILICRIILGIGAGFCSVRSALLIKTLPESKLSQFVGYGNVIASFTVVILSPIVGTLSNHGWKYAFLCNLFAVICLIFVFLFIKEPNTNADVINLKNQAKKIPLVVYGYMIIQFIATCALYPLLSGISSLLSEMNINNATFAGYMISIYTFGGVISNLLLSKMEKRLKKNALGIASLLIAVGNGLIIFGGNILFIALGIFLSGFNFSIISSLLQVYNGKASSSSHIAQTSTLILATNQLGIFLSSYFIDLSSQLAFFDIEIKNVYLMSMVFFFALSLVCFIKKDKICFR
ncbi:MAG: MFS transporter [Longibaculum sp.]